MCDEISSAARTMRYEIRSKTKARFVNQVWVVVGKGLSAWFHTVG
jgi:hypothetical protein